MNRFWARHSTGPAEIFGHHHPADSPAGHREVFREAVDRHRPVGEAERGIGRGFVGDAVIDLVGDQADAALGAVARERGERGAVEHRPGGIGGARDDQPVEAALGVEQRGRRLEPGLRPGRDADRLDAERGKDVPVGRV